MPRVAIIVLNWNRRADTMACLESLRALIYPDYEIVVVDNASSDGSAAAIRQQFPEVTLLENAANLGYAGGNNVGLRYALEQGADYAFLLNNDTVVDPGCLSALVAVAAADPAVGMAGPLIYYFDRPTVIWSAGGAIDWRRGTTRMIGLDEPDEGRWTEPRPVDFLTGCALLVKAETLRQIGLLDERFFAYYEDTEWGVRAVRAGYRLLLVPAAKVWHKIAPTRQAVSPAIYYYMTRNRLLFLQSSRAGLGPQLAVFWENLRTLASWTLRPRWRDRRPLRGVMARALGDYLLRRWGPITW